MKCGYITLLGRPNAGKSTLLNRLIGHKIAGVSRKPQTTRNRILGVLTKDEIQYIFLDTPGLHKTKGTKLNRMMNQVAHSSVADADMLVYLIDPGVGFTDLDQTFLKPILSKTTQSVMIALTKRDRATKQAVHQCRIDLTSFLEKLHEQKETNIAPDKILIRTISAKIPSDSEKLLSEFAEYLPESPWLFEDDDMTDRSEKFVCSELIREQVFRCLGQEIPYGCAAMVDSIKDDDKLVSVTATILVSRMNHKGMVIGKGASTIKKIGALSRQALESHFGKQVYLDLQVQVANGWVDDENLVKELSYMSELDELRL